jgi:hypothetical protein
VSKKRWVRRDTPILDGILRCFRDLFSLNISIFHVSTNFNPRALEHIKNAFEEEKILPSIASIIRKDFLGMGKIGIQEEE